MSTQSDIISPNSTQSAGAQINETISYAFLPRLKNKLVALAATNPSFRTELRDELTKEQSPKRGMRIDVRLPHFLNALDDQWDISGNVDTSGGKNSGFSGSAKDINSYQEWLLSVSLNQHIVLPLKSTSTMKKLLVNLDEWTEAAADKLSNRIDNRFLNMLQTAGGSGATVTNQGGRLNYNALEYVRGRIEANGEVMDGNLCAVVPTKLRHLITGDLSRSVGQYPEADVKSLTVKGALPNMLGGIQTFMATYVPTHTCGNYSGTITLGTVGNTHFLTPSTATPSQGVDGSVENEGFRVATMLIPLRGFTAASTAGTVLVRAGDEFVVGGNSGYANGIREKNLYNNQNTGNLQVFTVVEDVVSAASQSATTVYDVKVSPALFDTNNAASGAIQGIDRKGRTGNVVYFNGRPTQTYDQVFIWNKADACFLPVMIPELENVVNKTVMDENSGLTFNIATDSDLDDRSTLTRWDGWFGMNYFSYGNNTICRLRVQAHDGSPDGARTGVTNATTAAAATAATDLVDNADTTYTNHHGPYSGGLCPTCVVPVVPDVVQRSV